MDQSSEQSDSLSSQQASPAFSLGHPGVSSQVFTPNASQLNDHTVDAVMVDARLTPDIFSPPTSTDAAHVHSSLDQFPDNISEGSMPDLMSVSDSSSDISSQDARDVEMMPDLELVHDDEDGLSTPNASTNGPTIQRRHVTVEEVEDDDEAGHGKYFHHFLCS